MQYQICVLVVKMIESELAKSKEFSNQIYLARLLAAKQAVETLMVHY